MNDVGSIKDTLADLTEEGREEMSEQMSVGIELFTAVYKLHQLPEFHTYKLQFHIQFVINQNYSDKFLSNSVT